MTNFFKSKTCDQCGKKFDPVKESCPCCGAKNDSRDKRAISFDRITPVGHIREFFLAITQLVFIKILIYVVESVLIAVLYSKLGDKESVTNWVQNNYGALNFWLSFGGDMVALFIAIGIMRRDFIDIWKTFKNTKFLLGIPLGIAMLITTSLWSTLANQIMPGEINGNSSGLMSILEYSPVGYFLFAAILAPVVEEIMYRVGLFTFLKRIHPVVAYVGVGLVFGLIHMQSFTDPVEWLYFPGYAFGGIALSAIYDWLGFAGSVTAHITNNAISVGLTIYSLFLQSHA